jgi:hypothetical protein
MKPTLALFALTIAISPVLGQGPQITVAKDLDSSGLEAVFIQEIKLWKTLQADDFGAFKANLSPNFLNVTDIVQNRDQLVGSFKGCKFGTLNLQNHTSRALGPDAVVISYRLHVEKTCNKQSVIEDGNATTTWVRQKSNLWLAMIHTESPIKAGS